MSVVSVVSSPLMLICVLTISGKESLLSKVLVFLFAVSVPLAVSNFL